MNLPEPDIPASPTISVVLPVLDEEADISGLLEMLLGQQEPPGGFEVLVVDGGSRDRTREIVNAVGARDPRVRLLDNPAVRSSAGRNVGAWAARGEYVLFVDGHCGLPRPDHLQRLVEIFRATGAACLCRPQPLLDLAGGAWGAAIAAARHSWLGHNPGSDIYRESPGVTDPRSAGAAYRRAVILELGGYDERFDACEDVEFNHRVARAGLLAYRHPDLRLQYRPRTTLSGLYRQMRRYGRGRAHLLARHPGVIPWALVALTLVVAAGVATFVLAGPGIGSIVVGALALGYLTLCGIESLRLVGWRQEALRLARVFPVLHAGLLLGFWRGLLEFRRFRAERS